VAIFENTESIVRGQLLEKLQYVNNFYIVMLTFFTTYDACYLGMQYSRRYAIIIHYAF